MGLGPSPDQFSGSILARFPTWESHERRRRLWLALLLALVVWGLTDVRRRARIDPDNAFAHKTDFTVYTEAGRAFLDGRDAYAVTNSRGWHYLYPPLFALVVAPLADLDTRTQSMVWYVISVAACFGAWRECRRLWGHVSADWRDGSIDNREAGRPSVRRFGDAHDITPPHVLPGSFGWLAAATVALPAINCLQRGQVGIVLVYFLLLGLRLTVSSTNWGGVALGGLILALPVTIKLTPVLPVAFLLLALVVRACVVRRTYSYSVLETFARGPINRAAAAVAGKAAGLALFVFVVPAVVIGHEENTKHFKMWIARVAANDDVGIDNDFNVRSKRNQSLTNAVRRLGNRAAFAVGSGPDDRLVDDPANLRVAMPMETADVDRALRIAKFGVVGLLLAASWRVARRGGRGGLLALFGLACTATLIVSPISWGHHYVIWLPALVFVPHWLWHNGCRKQAFGLTQSALGLVMAHYLVMEQAGRTGVLGIGASFWYIAATIAVGWPRKRQAVALEATESKENLQLHEASISFHRAA